MIIIQDTLIPNYEIRKPKYKFDSMEQFMDCQDFNKKEQNLLLESLEYQESIINYAPLFGLILQEQPQEHKEIK